MLLLTEEAEGKSNSFITTIAEKAGNNKFGINLFHSIFYKAKTRNIGGN